MQELTEDVIEGRVTFRQALGRVAEIEDELTQSGVALPWTAEPGTRPEERRGRKLISWVVSRWEVAGCRDDAAAWRRRLDAELAAGLAEVPPAP
jgi:hypothetical protein